MDYPTWNVLVDITGLIYLTLVPGQVLLSDSGGSMQPLNDSTVLMFFVLHLKR